MEQVLSQAAAWQDSRATVTRVTSLGATASLPIRDRWKDPVGVDERSFPGSTATGLINDSRFFTSSACPKNPTGRRHLRSGFFITIMRSTRSIPAVSLKSVAYRYRLPRPSDRPTAGPLAGRTWLADLPVESVGGSTVAETVDAKIQRLEAILFLAREPLSSRKLSQYANLADGTEARTLVHQLNSRLDDAGRAFRVREVAGGFQLTTRPKFAKWLRRLEHIPAHERLSAPSMETLAVVAFRQPVVRAEIEAIRGVSCGEILNQLMNRDLIRVGGRSDELGRPYLYNTTKRFLQVFGLRSLSDLPQANLFGATPDHSPTEPGSTSDDEQEKPTNDLGG